MTTHLIEVEKIEPVTEPGQAYPASLMRGWGRVIGTPRRVSFVGDRHTMQSMQAMLLIIEGSGDKMVAEVEGWQIQEMN